MSGKNSTLNILSQVEDMVENVIASGDYTETDTQLLKEVKEAINWAEKIKSPKLKSKKPNK